MNFKHMLVKFVFYIAYTVFLRCTHSPQKAQNKLWAQLVRRLQGGKFWTDKVSKHSRLSDFDVTDITNYHSALERSMQTGVSEFTGEAVKFFAITSGTTGRQKVFPMTSASLSDSNTSFFVYLYQLCNAFPNAINKKFIYLAVPGRGVLSPTGIGVEAGSAIDLKSLPGFCKQFLAIPQELYEDEALFNQWAPIYAIASDIAGIFAVTPEAVSQFLDTVPAKLSEYLPYLQNAKSMPEDVPKLVISVERLRFLEGLSTQSNLMAKDIWPNIEFISCWTKSICQYQLPALKNRVGHNVTIVDSPYTATEGAITTPILSDHVGNVMHPGVCIIEFLPVEMSPKKENLLSCWELVPGNRYELIITNSIGLVRYRIFDMVECKGYFNSAPILEFIQKTSHFFSIGDVRFNEDELLTAVTGANINIELPFLFAPNHEGNGLVLYCTDLNYDDMKENIFVIDDLLKQYNILYDMKRNNGRLQLLRVVRLASADPIWKNQIRSAQSKRTVLLREPY